MNVYLVYREHAGTDIDVVAVFADEEDADNFVEVYEMENSKHSLYVEERTLWYGQPSNLGYNK